MTVFEYGDDIIIVDCGLAFPDADMMGVDLVIPDITYLRSNFKKIRGIFLTHGHEDHIGSLPYVLKEINVPVYGNKLTLGLVRRKLVEHRMDKSAMLIETQNGSIIYAGDWASTLAAAKMRNVEVTVSSPCLSVQYKGEPTVVAPGSGVQQVYSLGDISYLASGSATVILRCTSANPSKCDHGDLTVTVTADESLKTTVTSSADVVFPNYVTGDLVIDEQTVFDVDTIVSGDIHVKAPATLDSAKLSTGGDLIIYHG
ncbi:MAG: MBL fold metallo-hydrolase, partial [Clostridia bacterium]|nr:MBL fold metallo-hydrolase [Clostridia bacterium]